MASVKPDVPTDEEVERMRQYLELRYNAYRQYNMGEEYKNAVRDYALFLLLLTTGRRIGELLSVKVENIDWDKGIMWTIVEKVKKNINPRLKYAPLNVKLQHGIVELRPITVPDDVMRVVREYVDAWGIKEGNALFPYTPRWAQLKVKEWAAAAGITNKTITPHSFRHYLITRLRRKGWTYEDIMKVTGHKRVQSLQQTYDHTTFWDVKDNFAQVQLELINKEKKSET